MKKITICMAMFLTGAMIVSIQTVHAQHMKSVEQKSAQAGAGHAPDAISGKIVETMNSGGYTYVLLEKDGEKTWVAVGEMKVTVGQDISLAPGIEKFGFKSETLNRTFDRIILSTGPVSSHASSGAHKSADTDSKKAAVHTDEKIDVERASGLNAYTVADLYEKGAGLDRKSVLVRGKVVKVSVGIMNKNWLHIQDGTGDEENNTHDLVVTTQDEPSVGDVVSIIGTLYKDKDFGSGYKYDVIVEEATVKQE